MFKTFVSSGGSSIVSGDNITAASGDLILSSSATSQVYVSGALDVSGTIQTVGESTAVVSTGSYEPGAIKFVTDGNSGSPCLAVYYNGDWYRLTAGAVISST